MMRISILFLCSLFFLTCTNNKVSVSQKPSQSFDFSQPRKSQQLLVLEADPALARPQSNDKYLIYVIAGINDLHGTLFPVKENLQNLEQANSSIQYTRGGAPMLAAYIKRLKKQYGEQFILLDAGDEFQGSIESNMAKNGPGSPMVQFLNSINLQAAAVGNHEFDFGQEVLKTRMSEAHYPFLSANLVKKGTNLVPPFPHLATRLMIQSGPVKIGVIGLTTTETPTTTRPKLVSDLDFINLKAATLAQAQALREEQADLILLVAHVGLICSTPKEEKGLRLRSISTPQGKCRSNEEVTDLLASLPAGTIHGVISGHTHQVIHHFVSQGGQPIPVIQAGHHGRYLNLIYFPYDIKQKRFILEETKIEGPIPVCEKIFESNHDCARGTGELKTPLFHGEPILPDSQTIEQLLPLEKEVAEQSQHILGYAATPLTVNGPSDSPLANLLTLAMLNATDADFALINSGGIRSSIPAGPITYGDLFRTLPFDNKLCTITVSGEELKTIIKTSQAKGQRPFPYSGITLELLSKQNISRCQNVNPMKQEEYQFSKIIFWNGKIFDPNQNYKIALADFLVEGGSNLHTAITEDMRTHKNCQDERIFRDIVKDYIEQKNQAPLNSPQNPLSDPKHPQKISENGDHSPSFCF